MADMHRRFIREITPALLTPQRKLDMLDLLELPYVKAPGLEPRTLLWGFDFGVSPLCFFLEGEIPEFGAQGLICSPGGPPRGLGLNRVLCRL